MDDLIKRRDAINLVVSALNAEIPFTIMPDLMQAIPSSGSINHIQCKDCQHYNYGWCDVYIQPRNKTDYCNHVEARVV